MALSDAQLKFLKDEFGLDRDALKNIGAERWDKITLECCLIVGSEFEKANPDYDSETEAENEVLTERFIIAEEIAEMSYKNMMETFS